MKTLILAAGSQTRWKASGGPGLKQFVRVQGEEIIRRTYRLALERSGPRDEVITVVKDPENPIWEGLNPKAAQHEDWMGEMGKFLDHQHLWGNHQIVVLWGDAYYTEATLDRIYGHKPTQPTIYGRAQNRDPKGKRHLESFGMRWSPKDRDEVIRIAKECAAIEGMKDKGGPWRWFLRRHTGADKYDHKRVQKLATPENGWIEVGHDATDDFDDWPLYRRWRRRWRLR